MMGPMQALFTPRPAPDSSNPFAVELLRQLADVDQPPTTHLQTGELPCPAHSDHALGGES